MIALRTFNIVYIYFYDILFNVLRTFSFINFIFSCPGHPLITALADGFSLVKYVYIIIY